MASIRIVWLGAACLLIQSGSRSLIIDPFFENIDHAERLNAYFNDIDAYVITHGHFDHVAFTASSLEQNQAMIYHPKGAERSIRRWISTHDKHKVYKPFSFRYGKDDFQGIDIEKRLVTIDTLKPFDVNDKISIQPILSTHVRFDPAIFLDKLTAPSNWKYIPSTLKIARHYKKARVYGYLIDIDGKSVVTFGSMPRKITGQMKSIAPVDILFVPMAGKKSKRLVKPAMRLVEALNPRIVIPHHHNNFFPPISDSTSLEPFEKILKERFSEIRYVNPLTGEKMEFSF